MHKYMNVLELLSAAAVTARKAANYPADTYVIDLAALREIIAEMEEREAEDA